MTAKYDLFAPPVYVSGHPPDPMINKDTSPENWLIWHYLKRRQKENELVENGIFSRHERQVDLGQNGMALARSVADYEAIRATRQRA